MCDEDATVDVRCEGCTVVPLDAGCTRDVFLSGGRVEVGKRQSCLVSHTNRFSLQGQFGEIQLQYLTDNGVQISSRVRASLQNPTSLMQLLWRFQDVIIQYDRDDSGYYRHLRAQNFDRW
jgi:hypothetical protein